ncbi:MAG: MATE family efflux transporter [Helicobacteraceae bacterium]|nr:MATE family efflux transporter [Helicobacteraceae bacterium]
MKQLDLKNTSIIKLFLSYFIPSFISMFVLSTDVIIDGIFIGKGIGETGLSAVGLVVPVFTFFTGFELLFGIGGAALVSIALGNYKTFKAKVIFNSVIYFTTTFSILLGILLFILREKVVIVLGTNEVLKPYTLEYLNVILLGNAIIITQSILCTFARNDKAPNLTMISFISGSVINIILNYIFIFIFKWGMFGAALSTIIGHFIGLIIILKHFLCKNGELYFIKAFSLEAIKKSAINGIAPSMSEFAFGFIIMLMNIFLIKLGSQSGVAILSIMMYIGVICFTSILAISHGLQPIVSYNFGSKNLNRVLKTLKISLIFATIIGIIIYIVLYLGISHIARIFLKEDTKILPDLITAVKIYYLGYLFLGANIIISAFLQAISKVRGSIITSLSHNLFFMLIFLPLGAKLFGVNGIWLAYPLSLFCAFIVSVIVIRFELKGLKIER